MGLNIEQRIATESPLLADTIEKALANSLNPLAQDYLAACQRIALIKDIEEESALFRTLEAIKQRKIEDEELLSLERYLEAKQKEEQLRWSEKDAKYLKQISAQQLANDRTTELFKAELTQLAYHISALREAEKIYQAAPQHWQEVQQQFINRIVGQLANGTVTLPNGAPIQLHLDMRTEAAQEMVERLERGLDPERSPTALYDHPDLKHVKVMYDRELEEGIKVLEKAQNPRNEDEKRDLADKNKVDAMKIVRDQKMNGIDRAINNDLMPIIHFLKNNEEVLAEVQRLYPKAALRLTHAVKNIAEQLVNIDDRRKALRKADDKLINARILKNYHLDQIAKHTANIDTSLERINYFIEKNPVIAEHLAKLRTKIIEDAYSKIEKKELTNTANQSVALHA